MDLVLIGPGQVGDLVDPLVPEGKGHQVHQQVEGRQEPGKEAVAGKIAIDGGKGPLLVPQDINQAATNIKGQDLGNKVNGQGKGQDSLERFFGVALGLGSVIGDA